MVVLHAGQVRALARVLRGHRSLCQIELWDAQDVPTNAVGDLFDIEVRICGTDERYILSRGGGFGGPEDISEDGGRAAMEKRWGPKRAQGWDRP